MVDIKPVFTDDLLRGAAAIAEFIFNDRSKRRAVYHLAQSRIPTFKLGSMLCARKSEILKFVAAQEMRLPIGVEPRPQT